ncbi:MAG: ABC transporter ATP-binding protein/permease [Deltaproteobacteria bacterium]|nr:ABC transporter ATP-binding protein/permease [Deltaproteobacteria bacterium]
MFLNYTENIKNKLQKIIFVYKLLGSLKKQFWICVILMFFQAAWEGVIFTSMTTFFQSLVDTTNFSGGNLEKGSFMSSFYELFKQIPEEQRILIGFFFVSLSLLLSSLINIAVFTFQTKFSTLFIYQLRCDTFGKLSRNSLSFFDSNKKGELIQMVINETRACYSVLKSILELTINMLKSAVYIVFMVMLSFKLTLIVAFVSFLFLAESYFISRLIKRLSNINVEMTRNLTVITDESIQGIKHIKLFEHYNEMESSFSSSCWDADFSNRKSALMMQWQGTISQFLGLGTFFILVFLSVKYSLLATASLLTFLYILQRLNQSITAINQKYGFLNNNIPAMNKIINFLQEVEMCKEKSGKFTKEKLIDEKIAVEGIKLNYGKEEILKDISMDIFKGQTVALVGESGAGKTSLANLFVRFYDINRGKILIDGVKIQDFDLEFLRDRIGVVNQEPIIFNKTVRENIMMGNPRASEEEMIEAAKNAYAHDFIMELPEGYNTSVGDRGVKLSGGQRQRINISQIFLKSPEIIILDEATSALDSQSEQYIQNSLEKLTKNHTSIIIAHRLSTIKNADIIFVLCKGRLIEQGSWDSLMETEGAFHDMIKRQSFGNNFTSSDKNLARF